MNRQCDTDHVSASQNAEISAPFFQVADLSQTPPVSDQGDDPARSARAAFDLRTTENQGCAFGWQRIQVREVFDTPAAAAQPRVMCGKGAAGFHACIEGKGIHPNPFHIALTYQQMSRFHMEAGKMVVFSGLVPAAEL